MRSNHPRHVEIRLAVPADAAARREALEALLAGRGDLPFLRWRESPVAGHEVVGQNGDEPLRGESMIRQPTTPAALQPKPMHMVRACLPQALAR
jgi:hypothetical protein